MGAKIVFIIVRILNRVSNVSLGINSPFYISEIRKEITCFVVIFSAVFSRWMASLMSGIISVRALQGENKWKPW
jgi:hypothetical protein